jgi:hypothetical protein
MKLLILGMTGLCAGGTAWYMSDSPDFDRVVKKSPAQVYATFSQLAQQGTITPPGQEGKGPRISFRVAKVEGRSIHYEIQFDQRPAVQADLTFAAAGEDGRQTRLTAELDVDTSALGTSFQTEGGIALSMLQDRVIDAEFARMMNRAVDNIEAGRPLQALRASDLGVREASSRAATDPRVLRARAEARQQAASRPMNDARPMVDPNRAADHYLSGGDRNGGWGR